MFCILLIVPETAVYAEKEKDSDSYSDEADDDEIADAVIIRIFLYSCI